MLALLTVGCRDTYKVELNSQPAEGGRTEGAGIYDRGETIIISATANDGYRFMNWSDGNTDARRRFYATGNVRLTAFFETQEIGNEEQPNPDIMVTFDGKTWYGTAVRGIPFNDFGYPVLQLLAVQSTQGKPLPMAGMNIPTTTGSYASHDDTVYSCFYQPEGANDTLHYNGQTYPRWIALADADSVHCHGTVTALDLTVHRISMSMTATLLDMAAYASTGNVATAPLTVKLNNIDYLLAE